MKKQYIFEYSKLTNTLYERTITESYDLQGYTICVHVDKRRRVIHLIELSTGLRAIGGIFSKGDDIAYEVTQLKERLLTQVQRVKKPFCEIIKSALNDTKQRNESIRSKPITNKSKEGIVL